MKTATQHFLLVLLAGTTLILPAQAQEIPPAVAAMLDNFERQTGLKPTYSSLETDSSGNVSIAALTMSVSAAGTDPAVKLVIDEVELSDIEDHGDGLYEIGSTSFSGLKIDIGDAEFSATLSVPESGAEGWYVKALGDSPTPEDSLRAAMNVARKMSSGKMTITAMGQTITIDGYEQTWDGDPATGAGKFAMKLSNVAIPESTIAMLDTMGMMKQLGYNGVNFDLTSNGNLDIAGGNMGLSFDFAFAGRDMGQLSFGASASGIPIAVYAELQKAQSGGSEPDFNALMPQIQTITLNHVNLRFDDASLVNRVLPMVAAMQGMEQAAMVANAGAMVQLGLMQLQNQAFTDQTVAAVNSFLKEPKSLTVSAKPTSPVTVMELMGLNPANPGEAITKLGVTVSANN